MPHKINDCCSRSSRKRENHCPTSPSGLTGLVDPPSELSTTRLLRCQKSASVPRIASGKSQAICPPRGWVNSRVSPGFPVLNMPVVPPPPPPPNPPPDGPLPP